MEPTRFEKSLRGPGKVVRSEERTRLLRRVFEFAGVTIDDVVNDPGAKVAVLRIYLAADASEWESRRSALRERAAYAWWLRANR